MTSLSERAMRASLHVGVWSGSSHDKLITEEVSDNHHADKKDAGRYTKQLISKKFLKDVAAASSNARRAHRLLTLPWEDDGARILSAAGYMAYTEQMRKRREDFDDAVRQFQSGYQGFIPEAKTRLGGMFNVEDYPDQSEIKGKFSFDIEIGAIPECSDFRVKLSDQHTKAIVKDIEMRADARLKAAMNDIFERVLDVVGKMAEKLKAYKPATADAPSESRFHDSLVTNVLELANTLPVLNITGDPRIEELQSALLADLAENLPEILKTDADVRKLTVNKAEKLVRKVKSYMA